MNRIRYIFFLICCCISCDSESASPCFQTAGTTATQEFDLDAFNQVRVAGDMQLVVKQGVVQRVVLQSGKNIINDVQLAVRDSLLVARYDDGCNLVRDYGVTRLIVTVPELKKIRNATTYDVIGEGVLTYKSIILESTTLDADEGSFYNSGGFAMDIDNQNVTLEANGKALFKLSGKTENLYVEFADKTARLEGKGLIAQHVEVFHRSANEIIVNPQKSLSGILTGPGNLISVNRPSEVSVEERFTGKLIFKTP